MYGSQIPGSDARCVVDGCIRRGQCVDTIHIAPWQDLRPMDMVLGPWVVAVFSMHWSHLVHTMQQCAASRETSPNGQTGDGIGMLSTIPPCYGIITELDK